MFSAEADRARIPVDQRERLLAACDRVFLSLLGLRRSGYVNDAAIRVDVRPIRGNVASDLAVHEVDIVLLGLILHNNNESGSIIG